MPYRQALLLIWYKKDSDIQWSDYNELWMMGLNQSILQ